MSNGYGNGTAYLSESAYLEKARAEYAEAQKKKTEWEDSKGYAGHYAFCGVKTDRPAQKPTVEILQWVPVTRKPLVGMEHIVEVIPQFGGRRYYICTLCGKTDIQVFEHILSIEHVTCYIAENYEECQEVLEKYFEGKEEEKELIQPFIEAKGYPIMDTRDHTDQKVKEIRKLLLDLSVKLTQSMKRKRFTSAIEIESKPPGKDHPRQKPLVEQLIGHTIDHYSYELQDMLYYYGENFAYEAPAGWSQNGGLDQGFDSFGGRSAAPPPAGVVTMGQAKNKVTTEPIPFLTWLQKTEAKVIAEGFDQSGIAAAEGVKGLLACGIELFNSNPSPPTTICYYNKDPVNEGMPLTQWMNLTNTFFEEAWLCSQREVAAAQGLITHLEKAIMDAKSGKIPASARADPYDTVAADPYTQLGLRAGAGAGGMGGGMNSRLNAMAMGGGEPGFGQPGYSYDGFGGSYDEGYGGGYGGGPQRGGPRSLMSFGGGRGGRGGGTMGGGKPYGRPGGDRGGRGRGGRGGLRGKSGYAQKNY